MLQALAKIYYDASEFAKAAEVCELGRKARAVRQRTGWSSWPASTPRPTTRTSRSRVLKDWSRPTPTTSTTGSSWPGCCWRRSSTREAEKYAREAIEIDVRDAEARDDLLKALRAEKKDEEADRLEKILGKQ